MAYSGPATIMSWEALEDLSSDQYRIVVLDATYKKIRRPDAATDIPLGVLQNAPVAGEAANVAILGQGVSKVVLGATLAVNAIVGCEYVSASDAGKAIAAVATMYPIGQLYEGGDEDDVGTVNLAPLTVKA